MLARATAFCVVLVAGCASTSRSVQQQQLSDIDLMDSARTPGLFMGHSMQGDLVVAATHYDAMVGLATTADELGLPMRKGSSGAMLCQREMLTGTHLPQWTCRYKEDIDQARRIARDWLDQPNLTLAGTRGAPTLNVAAGSGGGNRASTLIP
jgi:hypothetical protein